MKYLIILFSLLFSTSLLQAQKYEITPRVGFNYNFFTGGDADDIDGNSGYHLGLIINRKLGEKSGVESGILYSKRNVKPNGGEWQFSYLQVPILYSYKLNDIVSLCAGPQFNVEVDAEGKGFLIEEEIGDKFHDLDFAATIGAKIALPAHLQVWLGFSRSLRSIGSDHDVSIDVNGQTVRVDVDGFELYNNEVQLSVGYVF